MHQLNLYIDVCDLTSSVIRWPKRVDKLLYSIYFIFHLSSRLKLQKTNLPDFKNIINPI